MNLKRALLTVASAVLLFSVSARADSGTPTTYSITGSMDFTSGGTTEQINYSFDYSTGPSFVDDFVSDMTFSSSGPFTITNWNDHVIDSQYVGFFDAAGDEFDLGMYDNYPSAPVIFSAYVWGCGSAECEQLFSGGSSRTDDLFYYGTVDPEVTALPTPEPSALLLLAMGIGIMGLARWKVVRQG